MINFYQKEKIMPSNQQKELAKGLSESDKGLLIEKTKSFFERVGRLDLLDCLRKEESKGKIKIILIKRRFFHIWEYITFSVMDKIQIEIRFEVENIEGRSVEMRIVNGYPVPSGERGWRSGAGNSVIKNTGPFSF